MEVDATILHRSLGNLGGPNSDHPSCCDVALGERLRKDVYEALRVPVHKSNSESGADSTVAETRRDNLIYAQAGGPRLEPHCIHHDLGRPRRLLRPRAAADGRPAARPPARLLLPQRREDVRGLRALLAARGRVPVLVVSPWVPNHCLSSVVSAPRTKPSPTSQFDGTSIVATVKRLFDLPSFLTRRDAWAAPFDWLFEDLDAPRTDAPMHLPSAPLPTPRPGGQPWGTDCDDPTRRMRRSILAFEKLLGVEAPSRLPRAHAEPHWEHRCAAGTMAEATAWLAQATERRLAAP